MSKMTMVTGRRERSRTLCRIVSERIGEIASPGLGRWDPAWEIVREPSARLLEALAGWERTGDEEAMDRAKAVAVEVVQAWREAERAFRKSRLPERTEVEV